jgi:hypothetical protein
MEAPTPQTAARRLSLGMKVSIGLNVVLGLAAFGLALYAFILNVDIGDLRRQLSKEIETRQQAERYLAETRNQLAERVREIETLKAQLEYRGSDGTQGDASKPQLPVVVGFRSSLLGKGMVAVIENSSDRYLTLVLTARNPTLATARRFTLELAPRSSKDFGHLEGWQFASGDELTLSHDDFRALTVSVP